MRQLILGTAGHIDHGKTALVRALTGVDTDRLPEEKRRGITIDLGFASLDLRDGTRLGIVDVPGHEAFVRNMLAGATGIDLMLLVVAADEGVMPQTREHLAIIELLGIRRGVVALTKSDLVDADWLELVREDVRALLQGTALADVPAIEVSARTGHGLDRLLDELARAAAAAEVRPDDDLFRMPVDRVFTVRGTGTVVTGTVWSGTLQRDAQVRVEPRGLTARVRGLQRHGAGADAIRAGERAAVALAGTDRHDLERGDCLLGGATWRPSSMLTVELRVLGDAPAAVRPRQRVRVHLGTAEVLARLALPDGAVEPGAVAVAQLRLEEPVVARAGDRVVIRSYSPVHTIAGGRVLEPNPPKRKRFDGPLRDTLLQLRTPQHAVEALLALHGATGVPVADLPVLTGLPPAGVAIALQALQGVVTVADRVLDASHIEACEAAVLARLARFHEQAPLHDGIEREALRRDAAGALPPALFEAAMQRLAAAGRIVTRDAVVARAGFAPSAGGADAQRLEKLAELFSAAGLQAPDLAELPPDLGAAAELPLLLRFLERQGRLVRLGPTRWADPLAVSRGVAAVRSQAKPGQALAVADFREVLNLSRKHLIPFLEYLDRCGVTVRQGEVRVLAEAGSGPIGAVPDSPPLRP